MSETVERVAFAIPFDRLGRWDPLSFHDISWNWPPDQLIAIGELLQQRRERVDRSSVEFSALQPITIHFDGSVDKREVEHGREYSMDLWYAKPGDVVVSKIDLKNGAVGIVPADWANVVVTGHFAVYAPDTSRLLTDYLLLLVQSRIFKRHLWRNKVGAEGRKEVKLSFFEGERVPLPSLETQRSIVAAAQNAARSASDTFSTAAREESAAFEEFAKELNLRRNAGAGTRKFFAAPWSVVERWGVDMVSRTALSRSTSKHPERRIFDVCRLGSGGTPSRTKPEYFGGDVPWVKTTEVRNRLILATEESITPAGLQNSSAKLYPAGSIIVAMYGQGATRGRTAKLGVPASTNQACAVLYQFDASVLPDFVWYVLMAQYEELRALASGNNQPNLNADMIGNFLVPVPPITVQTRLVSLVNDALARAETLRQTAMKVKAGDLLKVEGLLLGLGRE